MRYLASFTLLLAIIAFAGAQSMAQTPQPVITRVEVVYDGLYPQTL